MQQQYWDSMVQYAFVSYYYKYRHDQCIRSNIASKIIVALATIGTVTSWTIWDNFSWLLAIVIVILQIAQAAKDLLPFQDRVDELGKMRPAIDELYQKIFSKWKEVQEGQLTNSEISKLEDKFSHEWQSIELEYFNKVNLPERFLTIFRANNATDRDFESMLDKEGRKELYKLRKGILESFFKYIGFWTVRLGKRLSRRPGVKRPSAIITRNAPTKLNRVPMPPVKPAKPE
ncbi:MAG: hypothetical protein VB091_07890 [Christensenella sp.]|nr:hypothetical protein [Christensenella sp.]